MNERATRRAGAGWLVVPSGQGEPDRWRVSGGRPGNDWAKGKTEGVVYFAE